MLHNESDPYSGTNRYFQKLEDLGNDVLDLKSAVYGNSKIGHTGLVEKVKALEEGLLAKISKRLGLVIGFLMLFVTIVGVGISWGNYQLAAQKPAVEAKESPPANH